MDMCSWLRADLLLVCILFLPDTHVFPLEYTSGTDDFVLGFTLDGVMCVDKQETRGNKMEIHLGRQRGAH